MKDEFSVGNVGGFGCCREGELGLESPESWMRWAGEMRLLLREELGVDDETREGIGSRSGEREG